MSGFTKAKRKLQKRAGKYPGYKAGAGRAATGSRRAARMTARREANVNVAMGYSEKKNIDSDNTAAVGAAPPGWGSLGSNDDVARPTLCLNACQSGSLATNRVGRRINMTSLFIRARGWVPNAMTGQAFFRLIIVYDKECNTGIPTSANVVVPNHPIGVGVLGNGKRFKILADIVHPVAYSSDTQEGFAFDRYIKLNHPVVYIDGAGAGTYADIVSGGLFAIGWWGGAMSAAGAPNINLQFRVRYTDN